MPPRNEAIMKNPFYKALFNKFDKQLERCLDGLERKMDFALRKIESRLEEVEQKMTDVVEGTIEKTKDDLNFAEVLVNKELRTKIILSAWCNKFLSATRKSTLDPITFAMSRLAMNVSVCFTEVTPQYLASTGIHTQLVEYIGLKEELIVGPAIMGLMHMSLYKEVKIELATTGPLLPNLLKLMVHNDSKPILEQCCKLCASLVLHHPHKSPIANSGCLHALYDLILGAHQDVDPFIQYATLQALVNSTHESDSNRMLSVELNGISPILTFITVNSVNKSLILAIKVLANIAFGNGYTSNCILLAGGGEFLVEILESGDIIRNPYVAHAVLSTFSNICCSEINQSHVGSISNLVESAIRLVEYGRDTFVVTEAANFLLACTHQCTINKARCANKGAIPALVKRIVRHSHAANDPNTVPPPPNNPNLHYKPPNSDQAHCAARCCYALASILLHPANHERIYCTGAVEELVTLGRQLAVPEVIAALGQVLVTLVPSPAELLRYHKDDTRFPIEKVKAIPILKKAKFEGYVDDPCAPEWLDTAISILSKSDTDLLLMEPHWRKPEMVIRFICFKEYKVDVYPDSTVLDTKDFRGMIFSIY